MTAEILQAVISQIKERNYPQQVADYSGDILLVGIRSNFVRLQGNSYDKNTKQHQCQIERWQKEA